jgi:hypothetical protein
MSQLCRATIPHARTFAADEAKLASPRRRVCRAELPWRRPAILTTREEIGLWLSTPLPEGLELQRPLMQHLLYGRQGCQKDMVA